MEDGPAANLRRTPGRHANKAAIENNNVLSDQSDRNVALDISSQEIEQLLDEVATEPTKKLEKTKNR